MAAADGAADKPGCTACRSSQAAVLDQLTRLFGPQAAHPATYLKQDRRAEPFTRGAYSAVFPPGTWTQYDHALRPPSGRIHWAGAETATHWHGYIEGAIRSGEAAAAAVISS